MAGGTRRSRGAASRGSSAAAALAQRGMVRARARAGRAHAGLRRRHLHLVQPHARAQGGGRLGGGHGGRPRRSWCASPATPATASSTRSSRATEAEDRIFSVSRRQMIQALANAASASGAEIYGLGSVGAEADGVLLDGGRPAASGRPRHRRRRRATRGCATASGSCAAASSCATAPSASLIPRTEEERRSEHGPKSIEYWSGQRRLFYSPCSEEEVYLAFMLPVADQGGIAVPVNKERGSARSRTSRTRSGASARTGAGTASSTSTSTGGRRAAWPSWATPPTRCRRTPARARARRDERAVPCGLRRRGADARGRAGALGGEGAPRAMHEQRQFGFAACGARSRGGRRCPSARRSLERGARSKWLMGHRQRAAHHVPTGGGGVRAPSGALVDMARRRLHRGIKRWFRRAYRGPSRGVIADLTTLVDAQQHASAGAPTVIGPMLVQVMPVVEQLQLDQTSEKVWERDWFARLQRPTHTCFGDATRLHRLRVRRRGGLRCSSLPHQMPPSFVAISIRLSRHHICAGVQETTAARDIRRRRSCGSA